MGEKIILDEDASQVLPFLQLNQDGNGGGKMKAQLSAIPIIF